VYRFCVFTIVVSISILSTEAYADCTAAKGAIQFYECAIQSHPQFKAATVSEGLAEAYEDRARQLPNPEVSISSVKGTNLGETRGTTEISASLNLTELLIKRSANIQVGNADKRLAKVESEEMMFSVKQQVIRDLYRYRQVVEELELINEVLSTFRKIESQIAGRKARGPEQEVSLSLVQLAQSDYELQKNHLSVELDEISSKFKGYLGPEFVLKKELLPSPRREWPQINNSSDLKETFELRRVQAKKDRLAAERSQVVADSWPRVSAGPTFERIVEGTNTFNTTGFNVTVDLPIFSWNGGGREIANRSLEVAKLEHQYSANQEMLRKKRLLQVYNISVDSLKRSASRESLNRKHTQIDKLFRSGFTSGATIIEAHRQITEYTESQHEHELNALNTLMQIKLLLGQDISEVMK